MISGLESDSEDTLSATHTASSTQGLAVLLTMLHLHRLSVKPCVILTDPRTLAG